MSTPWIKSTFLKVNSSNSTLSKLSTAAISDAILSPVTLNNVSNSQSMKFATSIENKRMNLCQIVSSIASLVTQIQSLSTNNNTNNDTNTNELPQNCIEAIRHASYLCSQLPSIHDDECIILFQAIARFIIIPNQNQSFHASGWLHEKYIRIVPIERFDTMDRLQLCSYYPSIWRKYLRQSILVDLNIKLMKFKQIDSFNVDFVIDETVSLLLPELQHVAERTAYLACPLLNILTMHELQCQYIACNDDLILMALGKLMTALRLKLFHLLEIHRSNSSGTSGSSSSNSLISLNYDNYIPNGVWLSKVTTALGRTYNSPTTCKQLPSVVTELDQLLNDDTVDDDDEEKDYDERKKENEGMGISIGTDSYQEEAVKRNAIYLYLLSRNEHLEAATLELQYSPNSKYSKGANRFLKYSSNF